MSRITMDKETYLTDMLAQYTKGYDEGQQDLKASILRALEIVEQEFPGTTLSIQQVILMIQRTKVGGE